MDGAPVGLDLPAMLQAADALGYPRKAVARLLPYAESGMVRAAAEKRRREKDGGDDG